MANNTLTFHTNQFFAVDLKSPVQMGQLSIINSVKNISCLGTFQDLNQCEEQRRLSDEKEKILGFKGTVHLIYRMVCHMIGKALKTTKRLIQCCLYFVLTLSLIYYRLYLHFRTHGLSNIFEILQISRDLLISLCNLEVAIYKRWQHQKSAKF